MVHSVQPQAQYELTSPVWIGSGCQQIRVKLKGSSTPVGSVDLHYKQGGKAYISDLEVAQGHRRHGLGTMLMKAAMDAARRTGRTSTELEANPGPGSISKQSLVGMYEKLGFRNTGFSRSGNPKMTIQGKLNHQAVPSVHRADIVFPGLFSRCSVVQRASISESELESELKVPKAKPKWYTKLETSVVMIKTESLWDRWQDSQKNQNIWDKAVKSYMERMSNGEAIEAITLEKLLPDSLEIRTLDGRHRLTAAHKLGLEYVGIAKTELVDTLIDMGFLET